MAEQGPGACSIEALTNSTLETRDDDDETSDFSVSKNSVRNTASSSNTDQASCVTETEGSISGGTGGEQKRTGGHSEDTCYSSSLLNSEEASIISLPIANGSTGGGGHYEECTVSSTVTLGRSPPRPLVAIEKSEIFITMAAVPCTTVLRESTELERNLAAAHKFLASPLRLASPHHLEDDLAVLAAHLDSLEDAFVPASVSEEESAPLLADLVEVKGRLRSRQTEAKDMVERLAQCSEEMSGLGLWMKEVKVFLGAEEAAYGELETLEAQLRESSALQVKRRFFVIFL